MALIISAKNQEGLVITHARIVTVGDSAQCEVSDLRERVTELEFEVSVLFTFWAKLAKAVRKQDRYWALLHLIGVQLYGLQAGDTGSVSRGMSSQYSLPDNLGPLLRKLEPVSFPHR